jgi:BppU N-terminal domain
MSNIYQYDNGTVFEFTVKDGGLPVDIRGANVKVVFKTSTRTFEKVATVTDGLNGLCEVELLREDLSEATGYRIQGIVTFSGGDEFASDILTIKVNARL